MNCLETIGKSNEQVVIYDPCCGGAYLLTVLGFLCAANIDSVYASDISEEAVLLAGDNLSLLSEQGLERRRMQLEKMYNEYGKESHLGAIHSADNLLKFIRSRNHPINYQVFSADMMKVDSLSGANFQADIIITDVPYGKLTSWTNDAPLAIDKLLESLIPVLKENSIIAISSDKGQRATSPNFKLIRRIQVGKRRIELLQHDGEKV